jgi:uncharacterized repeat protein (TIGR02543 family)
MAFFRAIFCGVFLCLYIGVACAAQPNNTATRKAQGSGAYNERNADVNWKSSGSSNPCLGKADGTACKRNGSVGAKCKNQKCVITKCDKNTYLVVVDKGNDKYVSDGYCTSRTASCKDNERLLTVDFNGAPAAVKIDGKFKCTSFDDICTTEKKNELFAVEGLPIVGASTTEDYCRPTKCFDKYVLENAGKPDAKCVPCTACNPKNAKCELKGSNGVDQCYYETSCADGYEKEQNHDKYNPVCTEIPKPVVAPEPEPAPEPCDPAVLNAMAATHDANGNCVATKCLDKYVLENAGKPDAKCVRCRSCEQTNAKCELTGSDGFSQCTYKTSCDAGSDIKNNGKYNASCSKAEYAEIEEPEINVGPIESNDNVPDEKIQNVEFEAEQEAEEDTVYRITYDLDGGSGCENLSVGVANQQVSCTPTKDKFAFVGWCYDAKRTNCTSGGTFTIKPENDNTTKITMYAKWQEQERTECSEDEKDKFPNATEFKFENGTCKPMSCADKYELKDGKCVEQKRTECSDKEKKQFPNATEFKFENDKCEPVSCANGYKLKNGECVDDGVKEAEDNYKNAKERETSLENRMLGATTMAATGIGGMQLAQGLAEQNADDAAARDMAAYMATFQCRIGDKGGKSYPGGTSNIETPGANQLINTYQEYVALAKDLSERKSALGMKAGIEAEVILDKSATGLYDNVGHGVMGGTYASLYRAAMGSETDKQKLDSDKEASSNRVKGGAIAAGGGAVGGAIGNMLINGGDDDDADADDDKTVTEADCKKAGGTYKDGKCTCPGNNKVYKKGKCVDKSDTSSRKKSLGNSGINIEQATNMFQKLKK